MISNFEFEILKSENQSAHPYHDLSLPVLGVRSKQRSRFRGRKGRNLTLVVKA